jgi:MFS family permease
MVLFLSPAGAGALMNLFSSVAPDFHAASKDVLLVVALAGVFTAGGALAAGFILDRIDRWRAYPVAGLVTSLVAGGILLAPLSPATYVIGAGLYALVTGFAYAAYMALALDLVGPETRAGGTLFTLCTAAVNVPVVYMLRLDGLGHAHFGVRGMIGADGAANAVAAILLLAFLRAERRGLRAEGRGLSAEGRAPRVER